MREWLNQNQGVAYGIVAVVLVVALGLVAYATGLIGGSSPPDPSEIDVYWVDLETGEWFTAPAVPPEPQSPAGNATARAHMYACPGDGDDALQIGYLEDDRSDEAGSGPLLPAQRQQMQVVSADGRNWVSRTSEAGERIMEAPQCADGSTARPVDPGDVAE